MTVFHEGCWRLKVTLVLVRIVIAMILKMISKQWNEKLKQQSPKCSNMLVIQINSSLSDIYSKTQPYNKPIISLTSREKTEWHWRRPSDMIRNSMRNRAQVELGNGAVLCIRWKKKIEKEKKTQQAGAWHPRSAHNTKRHERRVKVADPSNNEADNRKVIRHWAQSSICRAHGTSRSGSGLELRHTPQPTSAHELEKQAGALKRTNETETQTNQ